MSSETDTSINVCLLVNVKEGGSSGLHGNVGRRFYYNIFFYFFNIFGLYAIDRYAKRHCSSLEIFWVCSALPHPPACLVSFSSQYSFVAKSQKACLSKAAVTPPPQAAQQFSLLASLSILIYSTTLSHCYGLLQMAFADRLTNCHLVIGYWLLVQE